MIGVDEVFPLAPQPQDDPKSVFQIQNSGWKKNRELHHHRSVVSQA
jgi:hypothetical protein